MLVRGGEIEEWGRRLIIIGVLLKLGGIPYTYWIMRVYPTIEERILLIQLTISKYIYIILLLRLEEIINPGGEKEVYRNILSIIGICTLMYGGYKGINQKTLKGVIGASSILTLGAILIALGNTQETIKNISLVNKGEIAWEVNHGIIIYIINILLLFEAIRINAKRKNKEEALKKKEELSM